MERTDGRGDDAVAIVLNGIEAYKTKFQSAMGGEATGDNIVKALATFVRTLRSEDSPWDKFEKGDKAARRFPEGSCPGSGKVRTAEATAGRWKGEIVMGQWSIVIFLK
jgi:cytochrome c peroxidase